MLVLRKIPFDRIIFVFASLIFVYVKKVHSWTGDSPNIRPFSEVSGYELGYVNMKLYNNSKLEVTPYKNVTVTNRTDCAMECVMSQDPPCESLNIEPINSGLEFICSLLSLDRYKAYPHFNASSKGIEHYEVDSKCYQPAPCIDTYKVNSWCIPNHLENTYGCYCLPYFHGQLCDQVRIETYKVTTSSGGSGLPPRITNLPVSKHLSLSFWMKSGQQLIVENYRCIFNLMLNTNEEAFRISMPNFLEPNVFNQKLTFTIRNEETMTNSVVYTFDEWHHVGITIDIEKLSARSFFDGVLVGALKLESAFPEKLATMGFGITHQTLKNDTVSLLAAEYKEWYIWTRPLEDKDFALLYEKKFIPYKPKYDWLEDLKSLFLAVDGDCVVIEENVPL